MTKELISILACLSNSPRYQHELPLQIQRVFLFFSRPTIVLTVFYGRAFEF